MDCSAPLVRISTPSPPTPAFLPGAGAPYRYLRIGSPRKPKHELRVAVVLLDGGRLEVVCDARSATVGDVLECATRSSSLQERPVALAAALCGELVFPPSTLLLARLARLTLAFWSQPALSASAANPSRRRRLARAPHPPPVLGLTLLLRVWLILPALPALSDACGRRLLYLELRRRVAEGRVRGSHAQLRALRVLAQSADSMRDAARPPDPAIFFSALRGARSKTPCVGPSAELTDAHYDDGACSFDVCQPKDVPLEAFDGTAAICSRAESAPSIDEMEAAARRAEDMFVATAARLPLAGAHTLDAVWVQSEPGAGPRSVSLAVAADAFCVLGAIPDASRKSDGATPAELLRVPWPCVRSLSHGARAFRVSACTPICVASSSASAPPPPRLRKYKFYLPHKKSLFLFHLASIHHQVYLKLQNQLTTIFPSEDLQTIDMKSPEGVSYVNKRGFAFEETYKENNMFHRIIENAPGQHLQVVNAPSVSRVKTEDDSGAFVLKSQSTNSDEHFDVLQETLNKSLIEKFDDMSFVDERVLFITRIRRNSEGSLGLQVECGDDGSVYVQGCVHQSHNIQKGDRIVAVNGRGLMHLEYTEALKVIKSSGTEVELILSRLSKSNHNTNSLKKNSASSSCYLALDNCSLDQGFQR